MKKKLLFKTEKKIWLDIINDPFFKAYTGKLMEEKQSLEEEQNSSLGR